MYIIANIYVLCNFAVPLFHAIISSTHLYSTECIVYNITSLHTYVILSFMNCTSIFPHLAKPFPGPFFVPSNFLISPVSQLSLFSSKAIPTIKEWFTLKTPFWVLPYLLFSFLSDFFFLFINTSWPYCVKSLAEEVLEREGRVLQVYQGWAQWLSPEIQHLPCDATCRTRGVSQQGR